LAVKDKKIIELLNLNPGVQLVPQKVEVQNWWLVTLPNLVDECVDGWKGWSEELV
jgi:hypothetical protein